MRACGQKLVKFCTHAAKLVVEMAFDINIDCLGQCRPTMCNFIVIFLPKL